MHLEAYRKIGGFTLLEILIVLVLVSIFVTMAVVQHSTSDASLIAQTEVLKTHLRYAQTRSIDTDLSWGVYYHYNNTDQTDCYYLLFNNGNIANIRQFPGETQDRVKLGEMGITLGISVDPSSPVPQSFQIEFDGWGRPTSIQLDSAGPGSYTLELTKPGHTTQQFVVTQNTGFID